MPTKPRATYQRPSTKELPCPLCGGKSGSKVVDSRTHDRDIRRRRKCGQCKGLFTTFERCDGAELVLPTLESMTAEHKAEILRVAAAIVNSARRGVAA